MSRTTRVFLNADSRFHDQNQKMGGKLKTRAMRVLAQRVKESLQEVNDPNMADVHFNVYQQPGSDQQWMLRLAKRSTN